LSAETGGRKGGVADGKEAALFTSGKKKCLREGKEGSQRQGKRDGLLGGEKRSILSNASR